MGAARKAAEQVTTALEDRDMSRARSWLADNFTFHDPSSPQGPMNADQWLGMNSTMHKAFPDLTYNFEIIREDGNQVWVAANFEGTHTGDLDLSAMGLGNIPASGREISTAKSTTRGVLNADGKVEKIEVVEQDENAGIMAILRQLGVEVG